MEAVKTAMSALANFYIERFLQGDRYFSQNIADINVILRKLEALEERLTAEKTPK